MVILCPFVAIMNLFLVVLCLFTVIFCLIVVVMCLFQVVFSLFMVILYSFVVVFVSLWSLFRYVVSLCSHLIKFPIKIMKWNVKMLRGPRACTHQTFSVMHPWKSTMQHPLTLVEGGTRGGQSDSGVWWARWARRPSAVCRVIKRWEEGEIMVMWCQSTPISWACPYSKVSSCSGGEKSCWCPGNR